jgi:iron complex transport system permease protein
MSTAIAPGVTEVPPERPADAERGRVALLAGLLVLAGVLVLVFVLSLALGSRPMPVGTAWDVLWNADPDSVDQQTIRALRLPRTWLGIIAGVALGLAGTIMQGVSRNPLADPGILGVNAGAALAVLVAIHFFGIVTLSGYVWFAFLGAGVAALVVYTIASIGREGATPIKLALAGTAVTALLGSLVTLLQLVDVEAMNQFRFWVAGSLAGRDMAIVWDVWPYAAVAAALALLTGRQLNALALGDDVARSLGQNVGRSRAWCALVAVLLSGSATAAAGPIVFIGLTIPHIARAICGPDYRWILPYSALLAPILLLVADVIGRLVLRPGELQVGILTALIGAPFFVALVRRRDLSSL